MKKFTSLLMLLVLAVGVMAQTRVAAPGALHRNNTTHFNTSRAFTGSQSTPSAAGQRAVTPFAIAVDFDSSESYHTSDELGGTYSGYLWRLNRNFPNDSLHNYDLHWSAVRFDTLVDFNTNQGYSLTNNPLTVDSVAVPFSYERNSGAGVTDTVIVRLYQTTPTGGITLTPNAVGGVPSNVVLWADTVLLGDTDATTGNAFAVYPAYAMPTGQHFALGVDFYGDTTNYFNIVAGGGDTCGNNCGTFSSQYTDNAQYEAILWQAGSSFTFTTPRSFIYFDCDNSGGFSANGCEDFYIQDFAYYVYMTIAPPLTANPVSSATNVCPGASNVTLTANASGGNSPYTYHWGGTGVQSPFDPSTSLAIPTSSLTGTLTYSLTVTDVNGDSIVKNVNLTLKGIGVNVGNDTTINCGTTVDLTANLTGSLGSGTSVQWTSQNGTFTGNIYAGVGAGRYIAVATNAAGCIGRDTVTVTLPTNQVVSFNLSTVYNGTHDTLTYSPCLEATATFTNTSTNTGDWTWTWTYGHGLNSSTTDLTTAFTTVGVDTVTLIGDSAGCSISSVHTISVLPAQNPNCIISGINDINLANAISVFPNPTSGVFNINFAGVASNNVNITVYDIVGKSVFTQNTFAISGNDTKSIDLSKNANGVYFVRVQIDGAPYTVRVSLNK